MTEADRIAQDLSESESNAAYYRNEAAALLRSQAAEIERLRVDAERLDFIQANPDLNLRNRKRRWAHVGFTNYEYETFKTVREAIDAAMKENKHD